MNHSAITISVKNKCNGFSATILYNVALTYSECMDRFELTEMSVMCSAI